MTYTERDRERLGRLPTWGDHRFQQLLRDGGGGEAARKLQAEVDAGRTDWDALRRDDDPRYAGLQREWAEGAAAVVAREYEEAQAADQEAAAGARGADDAGRDAEVLSALERAEAEGREPDEELRAAVGSTVIEGMLAGYSMGAQGEEDARAEREADEVKRARTEGPP